jgi:two-component system response regulator AtoC
LASANAALKAATGGDGRRVMGELPPPDSNGMQQVRALATRAAPSNINVLILGEMGVGKDVLARLIHKMSPRANKPFLALNCAGLTESLIEAELFGHEKGGFTGASVDKVGLFESANGGTIFLDEIGEMPVTMQAKLLQVIETKEIRPVRGVRSRPIDVRFISATNVDIESAVKKGAFRGDLMYRLNTLTLAIPPLRERKDEIGDLVTTFLAQVCRDMGHGALTVSPQAMDCLLGYAWPGNIRELRNVIERAVVLCDGTEILPEHLPVEKMRAASGEYVSIGPANGTGAVAYGSGDASKLPTLNPKEKSEMERIVAALAAHAGSQTRAAAFLGMSRRTFVTKLDRYGIPRPQKGPREEDAETTRTAGMMIANLKDSQNPPETHGD